MSLSPHLTQLTTHLRAHPILTTSALALSLGLIPALSAALASYRGWLALGPGGPPYNIIGWLAQAALRPLTHSDTTSLERFSRPSATKKYPSYAHTSFLGGDGTLPAREGARPIVPGYVAPQRQTTEVSTPAMRDRMRAYLEDLAVANPASLSARPSHLEGVGTPAVWLATPDVAVPSFMRSLKGESAHVHPEGSSHVVLSLKDAEEAVRKGWAERHRLSGATALWPVTYVLLYAPRDEGEYEVWKRIVVAAVRFVSAGGPDIKVE